MVLRPALVEALPLLRGALDGLIEDREGLRLHITEADNGLDIALSGGLKPGFETQDRLARTAEAAGGARLGPSDAFRQQHAKLAAVYPKDYAKRV